MPIRRHPCQATVGSRHSDSGAVSESILPFVYSSLAIVVHITKARSALCGSATVTQALGFHMWLAAGDAGHKNLVEINTDKKPSLKTVLSSARPP